MFVVTTVSHTIRHTESRVVTGEIRIWGYVRENGKDELVWELKNYKNKGNGLASDPKN